MRLFVTVGAGAVTEVESACSLRQPISGDYDYCVSGTITRAREI